MNFSWLNETSTEWLRTLTKVTHDFYHLPEYVNIEALRMGGVARAALIQDGEFFLFVPFVILGLRIGSLPLKGLEHTKDAVSPYGYPAPLFLAPEHPDEREEFLRAALKRLKIEMCARNIVSAFIRFHPLLQAPCAAFESEGSVVYHGETVWIDLKQSEAELWSQIRPTYRNLIRRMEKAGLKAKIDSDWQKLPAFQTLYEQTMDSVNADGHYYFGADYFRRLAETLEGHISLCVVENGSEIAAAGLFSECCGIVQYHLSGSSPFVKWKDATKQMLHFMTISAKVRSNTQFHLGGGFGSQSDSLFFFKSGFSKLRASYHTYRAIFIPDVYQAAQDAWRQLSKETPDAITEFFPSYRKPI